MIFAKCVLAIILCIINNVITPEYHNAPKTHENAIYNTRKHHFSAKKT